MIPKKIIFFGMLIIIGVFYYLDGRSLHEIQVKENRPKSFKRREKEQKQREEREMKTAAGNEYIEGECFTTKDDGWEYTKILKVSDRKYLIIDCHKYKGCTEKKWIAWSTIEYEFQKGRKIQCPR